MSDDAFFNPKRYNDDELIKAIDKLTVRLQYMSGHGNYGSDAYNQILRWLQEAKIEQSERLEKANEDEEFMKPGTIAIIGEDNGEEKTKKE